MIVLEDLNLKKANILDIFNRNQKKFYKSEDDKIKYYNPFTLVNPIIDDKLWIGFDDLYYDRVYSAIKHIIFKWEEGWINSERQLIYSSPEECISLIQLIPNHNKEITEIICYQRSSNIFNIAQDISFLNYLKNSIKNTTVKLTIINTMPHLFKNKNLKIGG